MGTDTFVWVNCGRSVLLTIHPFYCRGHGRVELYLSHPLGHTGPVTGSLFYIYTAYSCSQMHHFQYISITKLAVYIPSVCCVQLFRTEMLTAIWNSQQLRVPERLALFQLTAVNFSVKFIVHWNITLIRDRNTHKDFLLLSAFNVTKGHSFCSRQ